MKGVIFSISRDKTNENDVLNILQEGFYGIWQPPSKEWNVEEWNSAQAGTFADYLTLLPGDKVFFFRDRMIYGIGELRVPKEIGGNTPALLNYPDSSYPNPTEPKEQDVIFAGSDWKRLRVVFPFVPGPIIFRKGIDMDEALGSPFAHFFWGLRFWQGYSFRQLGEEETRGLTEIFLRRFDDEREWLSPRRSEEEQLKKIKDNFHGVFSARNLVTKHLGDYLDSDGTFKKENWLHALIIEYLKENNPKWNEFLYDKNRKNVFREVPASPPKPPVWADSMDILATSSHPKQKEVTTHYTVLEIKKDDVSVNDPRQFNQIVTQIMKYVEFLAKNYTEGNYGAISAFYVAKSFSTQFMNFYEESLNVKPQEESKLTPIGRLYVLDPHEEKPVKVWNNLKLMEYSWDKKSNDLRLYPAKSPTDQGTIWKHFLNP